MSLSENMGANESLIVIEQETVAYSDYEILKKFSSKKFKDVLLLYEIIHSNNLDESLLVNEEVKLFICCCTYQPVCTKTLLQFMSSR